MSVNALKSFKWLKLWTKLPQLFVAKYLAFDVSQFTCNFFFKIFVYSNENDMQTPLR